MDFRTEAEILYLYVVEGLTMEKVANHRNVGCTTSEVSEVVRGYGFNNDGGRRTGWQLGKDCGRYKPGKPAARGLTITRSALKDFMRNADDWDYDFEAYVDDWASRSRPPQRQQQPQRQQPQRQQLQYQPYQPPQPSYWELQRQQELERQERERLQRQQQERERQEQERLRQQQEQNQKTAESLVSQGRAALGRGDIRNAYTALSKAHELNPTWSGDALLAETYARAGNAADHANQIITLLTEHFDGYAKSKHSMAPTADQYLWRAAAYLNQGDKNRACDDYFRAADLYYEKKDYTNADRIYTEGREKTGYYSGSTPDAAFRVAFARNKGKNTLTREDHQWCCSFYRAAIKNNQQENYASGNISWHLRMLGDYSEAIDTAQQAIDNGLTEEYVYNNLFYAQQEYEEWEDAEETLDTMKYLGYDHASKRNSFYDKWLKDLLIMNANDMLELIERLESDGQHYESWLKGACLLDIGDEDRYAEAIHLLKSYLATHPLHLDTLCVLALDSELSYAERLTYCKRYLDAVPGANLSQYMKHWHSGEYNRKDIIANSAKNLQRIVDREAAEKAAETERRRREAEEAERKRREAEEAERKRREAEEAERRRREAEEAERRRREAEEAERKRREAEEAERKRREEEAERKRREEEALLLLIL